MDGRAGVIVDIRWNRGLFLSAWRIKTIANRCQRSGYRCRHRNVEKADYDNEARARLIRSGVLGSLSAERYNY